VRLRRTARRGATSNGPAALLSDTGTIIPMNIFYCADIKDAIATLDENESRHCIRVLRLGRGDQLTVVNGEGLLAECRILDDDPREVRAEIIKSCEHYGRLGYRLHIALAPSKSHDRYEWFLEKATEIGISEITPLICERSERNAIRASRAEKILVSAMKQSHRAYLPGLNDVCRFDDFIASLKGTDRFIAHCNEGGKIRLDRGSISSGDICILIGPEGDFTEREVEMALEKGCRALNLGDAVLRTETAGIVACAQVSHIFGSDTARIL
jgi:16S rRNA (uracil1498-N3)-methyltransferase